MVIANSSVSPDIIERSKDFRSRTLTREAMESTWGASSCDAASWDGRQIAAAVIATSDWQFKPLQLHTAQLGQTMRSSSSIESSPRSVVQTPLPLGGTRELQNGAFLSTCPLSVAPSTEARCPSPLCPLSPSTGQRRLFSESRFAFGRLHTLASQRPIPCENLWDSPFPIDPHLLPAPPSHLS